MDYLHESAVSIYRRRRRQRTVVTMTFVIGLCMATVLFAASYVQGWAGPPTPGSVANASCIDTANLPLRPGEVTVNVYNATERTGLAGTAASSLQKQGFKIATIDNDPLGKTIVGVGEIRHGPSGIEGATLAAERLPGARLVQDDRMDASVDVVVGKKFKAFTVPPKAKVSKAAQPTPRC